MQFLEDICSLFYPKICTSCKKSLLNNEKLVCTYCRHDLPIICYNDFKKNKITAMFYGKVSIESANTFLLFQREGKVKELIHALKYKSNQKVGTFLGNWFGKILLDKGAFQNVDIIIPVPLHKAKERKRGYNQLTTFGKSLGNILQIDYKERLLVRTSSSETQTFKNKIERFSNATTRFKVLNSKTLENKHILLIDDVITTGATLEACCVELQEIKGVKISIVTMAFTE